MTRSVKDLKEIICISRLNGIQNISDLKESLISAPSNGFQKKLSQVSDHNKVSKATFSLKLNKRIADYESWYRIIEEDSLKELLGRANKDLDWLCKWAEDENIRVHFMNWWLIGVSSTDRTELINLEYEIVCAEVLVIIKIRCPDHTVAENAAKNLVHFVLWEYPDSILSLIGPQLFLDYLDSLISNDCKHLLSAISITTRDTKTIHYCLSVRAFALVSLWCSLVRFHDRLLKTGSISLTPLHSHPPPGDHFFSLLSIAISHEFITVLQYWMDRRKLDIATFRDMEGRNLVTLAVSFKSQAVLKYLLDNYDVSEVINSVSKAGNSALHLAVCQGSLECVQVLVDRGHADLEVTNEDCDGCTPLHMAAIYGHRDIAAFLVDRGADSGAKTARDGSTSDLAAIFRETEMGELLNHMRVVADGDYGDVGDVGADVPGQ